MSREIELAEGAGRLLAFGLRPRSRPASEPLYEQLLARYRADSVFRNVTNAVAGGLGLFVLDAGDHGLVLAGTEDSPFTLRLSDYRRDMGFEERVCHGLIQVAIAAYCFPAADDLDDPAATVKSVSTREVVKYLIALCEEMKKKAAADPEAASPELQEAWRAILSRAETRETPDGRRAATTLTGMVAHALDTLERGGLLRRKSDEDGGSFQTLAGYKAQVRELAALHAFQLAQAVTRGAN